MLSILPGIEARTKFFFTSFYVCLFHLVLVRHLLQFKLLLEQRGLQSCIHACVKPWICIYYVGMDGFSVIKYVWLGAWQIAQPYPNQFSTTYDYKLQFHYTIQSSTIDQYNVHCACVFWMDYRFSELNTLSSNRSASISYPPQVQYPSAQYRPELISTSHHRRIATNIRCWHHCYPSYLSRSLPSLSLSLSLSTISVAVYCTPASELALHSNRQQYG